jgi:predicted alpha/beta superfamily hydrolase
MIAPAALRGAFLFLCLYFFVFSDSRAREIEITFTVHTPKSTPHDAIVYIAGNHSLLGDWNPGAVAMEKISDSVWSKSFRFPEGFSLEYKITLGSWDSQAVYTTDEIPPNSYHRAAKNEEIVVQPINWSNIIHQAAPGGITGTVEYHRQFRGENLQYARDVIVWLPPSYRNGTSTRNPVLYMHDGQNIIDPRTSYLGYDWRADEVSDSLIHAGTIEEIVIVGIYNSPDRTSEYSDSDRGKAYAKFIAYSVKPFIDSLYRTKPDRANTAVMGSSMGGLISFLCVWWYPEIFSKAGCLSSVFDSRSTSVVNLVRNDTGRLRDIKIYLDCGGFGGEAELKSGMDEMIGVLKEKGYRDGFNVLSFFDPAAGHNERAWAARLWRPLVFMFHK